MSFINVGKENSSDIDLYYEDHGSGKPIILIHGYPLNGGSWEKQAAALLASGCRVITYDRRGFGKSSQPTTGYDYDTFAEDLRKLVTSLELRDFALVGFSMGGGEVGRYLGKYGSQGVSKAVFISSVPPFLLKTPDNPEGVDLAVFQGIEKAVAADRYAFFNDFFKNFYNTDVLLGKRISEQAVQGSWNVAAGASATASLACVPTWYTDFRKDLPRIEVPTLVIHGDADRIVPINASGRQTAKLVKGAHLVVIEGGPHGLLWTHADQVNRELVDFLGQGKGRRPEAR
jgi:pimeloyl-ACP methyl ester carboxylesterase